jgi:DNA replication and repair protein RecF
MLVEAVHLRDFRNYERAAVELGAGLTVICGPNGAGKTNLLEGIYFGLTGRSCRTSNEREVVRHGAGPARVVVTTVGEDGRHELEVAFEPGEAKRVRADGVAAEAGALDARPPVVVFVPERLELVKGAPAHRRAHLDRFVAAVWPARAETRAAYARALGQRNALLARVRAGHAPATQLDAWDAQLARCAAALMADRAEAVGQLRPRFHERAAELGLPRAGEVTYRPRARATEAEGLARELADHRVQDLERGFTTHGPHRDDLMLVHGDRGLRAYGSQGQQRLALLALLFAERDVLAEGGRPPLLLLDDVMSELDADRRQHLVEAIRAGGQAVVTATDHEHVGGVGESDVRLIMVEDGQPRAAPRAVAA